MKFNKKASLEMSIQAIVIVVLAMTLLGLGLGFIKGMFKDIGSTTEDVSEQVRQKVLDDLIQTDKRISFPKSEIQIDKNGATVLTVGIRNKGDNLLKYKMVFDVKKGPGTFEADFPNKQDNDRLTKLSEFGRNFQLDRDRTYELAAANSDVRSIRLNIPPNTEHSGSYLVRFEVEEQLSNNVKKTYATKDFFVVVRG